MARKSWKRQPDYIMVMLDCDFSPKASMQVRTFVGVTAKECSSRHEAVY